MEPVQCVREVPIITESIVTTAAAELPTSPRFSPHLLWHRPCRTLLLVCHPVHLQQGEERERERERGGREKGDRTKRTMVA